VKVTIRAAELARRWSPPRPWPPHAGARGQPSLIFFYHYAGRLQPIRTRTASGMTVRRW